MISCGCKLLFLSSISVTVIQVGVAKIWLVWFQTQAHCQKNFLISHFCIFIVHLACVRFTVTAAGVSLWLFIIVIIWHINKIIIIIDFLGPWYYFSISTIGGTERGGVISPQLLSTGNVIILPWQYCHDVCRRCNNPWCFDHWLWQRTCLITRKITRIKLL